MENDKIKHFLLAMPLPLHTRFKIIAAKCNRGMAELACLILDKELTRIEAAMEEKKIA